MNNAKIVRTKDLEEASSARPRAWRLTIRRGNQVFQTVLAVSRDKANKNAAL